MLVIRLARRGRKDRPFYCIVVIDSRKARDSGRFLEILGFYNPIASEKEISIKINQARLSYWLSHGAQLSDTVKRINKQFTKLAA